MAVRAGVSLRSSADGQHANPGGRLERGLDSEGVLSLSILMLLIKPPTASVLVLSLFPSLSHSLSLLLLFALSVSFSLSFVPVLATLLLLYYAITLPLALYRE